jgi:hypothetical protein
MQIVWPSNTRETINNIINAIGRTVTFYTATLSGCTASGCSLDPVTDESTNSFCPVCSGQYWIPIYSGTDITAHITWKYADRNDWQTGGYVFKGDGIIKVMYSGNNLAIVQSAEYAVLDGKQISLEGITLLGVPTINRVIVDFKEKEKTDE